MNAVLTTNTTDHWVEVLEAAGVPCGPVYNYTQMFADPQVRHHGLVQCASDAELGEVPHIRTPVKIAESVRVRTVAPSSASTMSRSSAGSASLTPRCRNCAPRGTVIQRRVICPRRPLGANSQPSAFGRLRLVGEVMPLGGDRTCRLPRFRRVLPEHRRASSRATVGAARRLEHLR